MSRQNSSPSRPTRQAVRRTTCEGVRGHLDPVAGPQALGHVAGVGLDGQLDLVGGGVEGEQELGGHEGLLADRCGEHAAGDGLAGGGLEVVAQGGAGQPDPHDHEVAVVQGGAGGQVAGGGYAASF
jgi:hypothetical protein